MFINFDIFSKKMSLEILNLSLEKISKLKVEFGDFLQTQPLSVCVFSILIFFSKKMSLEILNLSLEKISKLKVGFGDFLQTQLLSVCFFQFRFFFDKNEFGDFEPEFGENLQTQKS